jgi:hypothetical protein
LGCSLASTKRMRIDIQCGRPREHASRPAGLAVVFVVVGRGRCMLMVAVVVVAVVMVVVLIIVFVDIDMSERGM